MVFSSIIFLLYFLPLFLLVLFVSPKKFKNIVILISSIFFYSWGAPKFIFVILITTILDFFLVKKIHTSEKKTKTIWLIISLLMNLGLLFCFKYCNFFIDNLNVVFGALGLKEIKWLEVVLPIGISFYTFESITYVVDVYRGEHKPLNNFWDYQLYIILFPKLIAGPIIRYHDLANQINDRSNTETIDNKLSGFYRFCIGLAKKVIIANSIGKYADDIFNSSLEIDTISAWIGAITYTFQIYFDFSGYSDMAIGLGRMMGFIFPENFNHPYISKSITEFWRRWHISLGSWMRNYLYIPLGGNKVETKTKLYFNLWLVFIFSGFWHGASWNFIFWGIFHGFFLVIERAFLLKLYEKLKFSFLKVIINFIIVMLGWVLFRANDLTHALKIYSSMFSINFGNTFVIDVEFVFYLVIALLFSFYGLLPKVIIIQDKLYFNTINLKGHLVAFSLTVVLFILSVSFISTANFNPFIYFRF